MLERARLACGGAILGGCIFGLCSGQNDGWAWFGGVVGFAISWLLLRKVVGDTAAEG